MSGPDEPTAPNRPERSPRRSMPIIEEAGRQLRAPWAASIAGLLFSVLFTAALVLVRSQSDQSGQNTAVVIGGLYLAPFAGIMFLWFVAVIRDQIGEREDRFFATVFFGSGLLFVGPAVHDGGRREHADHARRVPRGRSSSRRRARRSCAPSATRSCSPCRRALPRSSWWPRRRSGSGAACSRAGSRSSASCSASSCSWPCRSSTGSSWSCRPGSPS